MNRLHAVIERVGTAVHRFDARTVWFDVGRFLLALSQLSLLLTTSASEMFVPVGPEPQLGKCDDPFRSFSAFCWADPETVRWVFVGILALVCVGLVPRFSSWAQWYVAVSIGMVIDLPEGGEAVLLVATFWIALVSIADNRWLAWRRPVRPSGTSLNAVAWAALWGLRVQLAYVYLNSALAKLPVEQWGDGTAIYYVIRMEFFGAVGPLGGLARFLTSIPLISASVTWGTVALEVTLAVLLVGSYRMQRYALVACVALHLAIGVLLGLASFALAMVGAVACATSPAWRRPNPPHSPDMSSVSAPLDRVEEVARYRA